MSSRLKLAGICFAAAFVLAACGGGGGSPLDSARSDLQQVRDQLAEAERERDAAVTRYMLAEAAQMLDDTPADDTAAQAQLRAALARAMAAEGTQMLPADPADDTAAQAQLRAALARAAAAEGMQMLPADPADDTAAQAQLRAALARAAMAEGTQMLPADPADDTAAQAQLRAALKRAADAEGMQDIAAIRAKDPADRTAAEQQLLDAVDAQNTADTKLDAFSKADDLDRSVATLMTLSAAATEDGSARMIAMKYSALLGAVAAKGSSMTARQNAQMVLDAKTDLENAILAVNRAKTAADTAKGRVSDEPTIVKVLDDAIEAAEEQIKAAQMVLDEEGTGSLAAYVAMVTGTDADALKDAGDVAKTVAMAVGQALLPTVPDTAQDATTHDGTPRRVTGDALPATTARTAHAIDSNGMSWAMIVGEGNVMDKRIVVGTATRTVKASSVAGMNFTFGTVPDATADGAFEADGTQYGTLDTPDTNYKGIAGVPFCNGSNCRIETVDDPENPGTPLASVRKLVGSWYFTPADADQRYVTNPDATARATTPYVPDVDFVTWGHWIADDTTDPTLARIHTYAYLATGGNTTGLDLGVTTGSTSEFETATYTGDAAGMSLHKTFDDQGNVDEIHSGAFTANVTLTARFGSSPMLGGRVWNFQGGAHVDSTWSVTLEETGLETTAALTGSPGVAKGSGQAGDWTAQGHGPTGERPTGFFGQFNAHFTDGHAAGVYTTRPQ